MEHLHGNVASQGCANPNVYLQINPEQHQECFTRNKRDFVFQVMPKLNYDARRDYEAALQFYSQTFVEHDDGDAEAAGARGEGSGPTKRAGRSGVGQRGCTRSAEREREKEDLPPVTPHPRMSDAVTTAKEKRNADPLLFYFAGAHVISI